jgi:hypothetical protein
MEALLPREEHMEVSFPDENRQLVAVAVMVAAVS